MVVHAEADVTYTYVLRLFCSSLKETVTDEVRYFFGSEAANFY